MKLGLFGGGFKPFTTGHFSKLADALRDNDKVTLFYGMQQAEPVRYGKRGKPLKARGNFRSIGDTGRAYDEQIAKDIFSIYRTALERIPGVTVVPIYSQARDESGIPAAVRAPVSAIFKTLEDFIDDPGEIEKITIYGDGDSMRPYMRSPKFKDAVQAGKIQFGGAVPESYEDYLDPERLDRLMSRGSEEARQALASYYPDLEEKESDTEEEAERKREQVRQLQSVRGTEVRRMASQSSSTEEAKRFLPPFLNNSEKEKIIGILLGQNQQDLGESYLREFIRGVIRG